MQSAPLRPAQATPVRSPSLDSTHRAGDGHDHAREIDLVAMVQVLWRGKWVVMLTMAAAICLAGLYAFVLADPLYTATAVVALENRDEQIIDLQAVMSGVSSDQASINTELEVLRSRSLAKDVVDHLDLINDPEFNASLRPENPWSLGHWVGKARSALGVRPDTTASEEAVLQKTIDRLLGAISVSNVRQSYVFEIRATTLDPVKSAHIADAMADRYALGQLQAKSKATVTATEWLTEGVDELKDELAHAATAVTAFNTSTELISPERLTAMNRQLKEFRERRADLLRRQADLDARVTELMAASETGDLVRMAELIDYPRRDQLDFAPDGSEADRNSVVRRFQHIVEQSRSAHEQARTQVETLSTSIAHLESQIATQSDDLLQLEQLERQAEATRALYEYFLTRLKETSVQQGLQQPDSRILSSAVVPQGPSSPRRGLILAVAALLGIFTGSTTVLIREARNATYRTAQDLEQDTNILVMGQVPHAPRGKRQRILEHVTEKSASALAEAIRNLRTSILLANFDRPTKVIMMTSSVPDEGKTTLSLALAQNLAMMGHKVLVIEGDLRKRALSEIVNAEGKRGIVSAVTEAAPLEELIHQESNLYFDVLAGERLKVNAADFFSSDRFGSFLVQAKQEYDFIIIDTPPVLIVPDARVIGQHADVVAYVVKWGSTLRRQVQQGLHSFASVNVPVTGFVLNQIDPSQMRNYGYGYGYGYGSTYYDN